MIPKHSQDRSDLIIIPLKGYPIETTRKCCFLEVTRTLISSIFIVTICFNATVTAAQTCPETTEEILAAQDQAIARGDLKASRLLTYCRPVSIHEKLVLTEGDALELPETVEKTITMENARTEIIDREFDVSFLPESARGDASDVAALLNRWFEEAQGWFLPIILTIVVLVFDSRFRNFLRRPGGGPESQKSPISSASALGLRFQVTGDVPAFINDPNFVLSSQPRGLFAFGHPVSNLFFSGNFPAIFDYRFWQKSWASGGTWSYKQTVYCFRNRRTRYGFKVMTTETAKSLAKIRGNWAALKFRLGIAGDRTDLEVGDGTFDEHFHIEGASESELRRIFHGHLRVQLLKEIDDGLIIEATRNVTIFYRYNKVDRGTELTSNYRRYRALHSALDG